MIKKKLLSPTNGVPEGTYIIEVNGSLVGPRLNEEEADIVLRWLNLSTEVDLEVEKNENNT